MQDFQDDRETHLLLSLSDSNLPTGSFVASAGLESTATHALLHAAPPTGSAGTGADGSNMVAFIRNSVDTHMHAAHYRSLAMRTASLPHMPNGK